MVAVVLFEAAPAAGQQIASPAATEGDFVAKNFKFRTGESLPELRFHYTTLGKPARDAQGRVTNAVLILHGTGGTGHQFLQPVFAGKLFGPGQLLDAARYYIILPDGIGHGKSAKPSDGLHAHFPQYDYDDMVLGHYRLLTEGLGVNHLRLILGTSMGCMHSFVWGETYPDFMDALMPLACQPVQIAGRNRVWRKMVMDAIRNDPEWKGGEYTGQPQQALRTALDLLLIAGSAPLYMQKTLPTRDAADKYLADYFKAHLEGLDANDLLYAVNASRNYDPSPQLEKIAAPVMYINSADDFINPPELGMTEREIKRVKNGRFVLLPITDETRGHGTHTRAAVWKPYLEELMNQSRDAHRPTKEAEETTKSSNTAAVEAELRAVENERHKASVEGDSDKIASTMTDDYLQTDIYGHLQNKAIWLDEYFKPLAELIKAGKFRWEVFEEKNVQFRVHGDNALTVGDLELKGVGARPNRERRTWEADPNASIGATLRFTHIYVRREGRWLLAALHNSMPQPVNSK
jgi:homoserine O-acetyltransferase